MSKSGETAYNAVSRVDERAYSRCKYLEFTVYTTVCTTVLVYWNSRAIPRGGRNFLARSSFLNLEIYILETIFFRTLWFLMYAVTVPAMVYMVYNSYLEFMENPLFTSVETEYFPTHELNFPGKLNALLRSRLQKDNVTRRRIERSFAPIGPEICRESFWELDS